MRRRVEAAGMAADGCLAAFIPALAVLVGTGAPDAAEAVATHRARVEAIAAGIEDPAWRTTYLERVPWHRHVFELERALAAAAR